MECPADCGDLVRLTFPFHLLHSLGWQTQASSAGRQLPGPCYRAAPAILHIWPSRERPCMPPSELRLLQALWLFRAQLHHVASGEVASCQIEVQVVDQQVWTGRLGAQFSLSELEQMWSTASHALHLPAGCRVLSGPFVHAPATKLGELQFAERQVYRAKPSGWLMLTVMPHCHGGGAKTDTKAWAATKVAASCLAQGMSLSSAPDFAERLVSQCANKKLETALHAKAGNQVWASVKTLAEEAGVELPALNPKNVAADVRLKNARTQRRLQQPTLVTPEEVFLQQGHFRNADGTEASVLTSLHLGATGIMLVTRGQAKDILHTLADSAVDEMALLILGHDCPLPCQCGGRLELPARAKRNQAQLLLPGCIHNLGPACIKPKLSSEASVSLPKVRLFHFDMLARDMDSEEWLKVTQAPVRAAQDRFIESGLQRAIMEPWNRRFSANGRPSQPESSDKALLWLKSARKKLSHS